MEEGGGEEWEWEWEWSCVVPREGGGERGGGDCMYEGGDVIEMPGREQGRFLGGGMGNTFEVGVPLLFVVKVRVRGVGGTGEVISEGYWEETFSVVDEGEEEGWEVRETRWMCESGTVGYLVSVFFLFLIDWFLNVNFS